MPRNQAIAALAGLAVLALAACTSAQASQPLAKTAASRAAQPRKPEPAGPVSTHRVPTGPLPTRPLPTTTIATSPVPANPAPANPAPTSTIPAGVTSVTLDLTADVSLYPSVKFPQPATVTDPVKIRQLTALINGLPAFPGGMYHCPADDGESLVLTFAAGRGRSARAAATVYVEGCEGVNLTVDGRRQPELGPVGGGRQTATKALKIVGLHWSLI